MRPLWCDSLFADDNGTKSQISKYDFKSARDVDRNLTCLTLVVDLYVRVANYSFGTPSSAAWMDSIYAEAAIRQAVANASDPNSRFNGLDITKLDSSRLPRYDGAFLICIMLHVKRAAPAITAHSAVTSRVAAAHRVQRAAIL